MIALGGRADEVAGHAGVPLDRTGLLIARDQLLCLELDDEVAADPDPRLDVGVLLPQDRAALEVVRDDRLVRAAAGFEHEHPWCPRRVGRRGLFWQLTMRERRRELIAIVIVRGQMKHRVAATRCNDGGDNGKRPQALHLPPPKRASTIFSASARDWRGGFFGVASM